jgi:hypothetical protein
MSRNSWWTLVDWLVLLAAVIGAFSLPGCAAPKHGEDLPKLMR